jgi:predicted nucleic acid-binding protein
MIAYVDSSVLLRLALGQPGRLVQWPRIDRAVSSTLAQAECARTLDRLRHRGALPTPQFAKAAGYLKRLLGAVDLLRITDAVLRRAGEPFASPLGTLDAIHLASALLFRDTEELDGLVFATHDAELSTGAQLLAFETTGA